MAVSQLHETATDCICVILQALGEDSNTNRGSDNEISAQLQDLQSRLFTSVTNLEPAYHFSVAHEDMEK